MENETNYQKRDRERKEAKALQSLEDQKDLDAFNKKHGISTRSNRRHLQGQQTAYKEVLNLLATEHKKIETFLETNPVLFQAEMKGALDIIEGLHKKVLKHLFLAKGQLTSDRLEFEKLWKEYRHEHYEIPRVLNSYYAQEDNDFRAGKTE